jgi:hypothetical protein
MCDGILVSVETPARRLLVPVKVPIVCLLVTGGCADQGSRSLVRRSLWAWVQDVCQL